MRHHNLLAAALLAIALAPSTGLAQFFFENFEIDPSANWTLNNGPSDAAANFFFDYSTVGIPKSPSSALADGTRGLKLQANLSNGIFSGMSVSPTGKSFTGNYKLRFDWWANFNGPFPAGGSGSTNLSTFGVGTSGTTPQWPGGVQDSVWFAATGDGGSTADWRAYSTAAGTSYPDGSPVYEFATRNHSNLFFTGFGGHAAPAAQLALFPQQSGSTFIGTAGMAWHDVVIEMSHDFEVVTWRVDGVLMATIDLNTVTLGGSNVFFGHSDINATSSTDVNDGNLLFTLIDNIRVVPEPSGLVLWAVAASALIASGRRKRA
jgi:hypothetical protein